MISPWFTLSTLNLCPELPTGLPVFGWLANIGCFSGEKEVISYQEINTFVPIKITKQTIEDIVINDYVWIGTRAMILPNVELGEGVVVCAGAVVTKNVSPYTIVGGVPAREIGKRSNNLNYSCNYLIPFD